MPPLRAVIYIFETIKRKPTICVKLTLRLGLSNFAPTLESRNSISNETRGISTSPGIWNKEFGQNQDQAKAVMYICESGFIHTLHLSVRDSHHIQMRLGKVYDIFALNHLTRENSRFGCFIKQKDHFFSKGGEHSRVV